eukprot:CAMPEP_0173124782 /NCGR_PEP_ID=MMETSP1102-20130122/55924_1 /TAXON_ID=49646 /ORGANISM="Geminigera sp., Strain Caron Lab Isolate" /LENGTH=268 /DNA_ID=CAMNT_0014033321 /DNA_START=3 /DNA_END=809 /DNA_ORIENTATION=-
MTAAAKVLLLGGTGGIGSQALLHLLDRNVHVTAIVRSAARLPDAVKEHPALTTLVRETGAINMSVPEMARHVEDCDAVISCLGHNLDFHGMFGEPKKLCADTSELACEAIKLLQPTQPIKFIVVNTAGVDHPDGKSDPVRGWGERVILWLLTVLLPPMKDNVMTSHYLYNEASKIETVEFCAVRPDDLIDGEKRDFFSSELCSVKRPSYTVHETLQNGLFNPGTTTRANVGHFMADLVTDDRVWAQWKGKFPQIIDVENAKKPTNKSE